jgi:hypothetical protein
VKEKDAVHWAVIIAQQPKIEEKTLIVQKLQVPTAQKRWGGGVGRWVKGADREVEKGTNDLKDATGQRC